VRNFDILYADIARKIMAHGDMCHNRTGVDTLSLFGQSFEWDMRLGFPLLGLRKLGIKMPALELQWMIAGGHTTDWLHKHGCFIWDKWQNLLYDTCTGHPPGELGRIYGAQWRNFGKPDGIDQLRLCYDLIKIQPNSRRIIMSLWSPNELNDMALPPCHVMFQFSVKNGGLSLLATQRSMDFPVGGPHDIAQFALFLRLMARATGYEAHRLIVSVGDLHIYANQVDAVNEMLTRSPTSSCGIHLGEPAGEGFLQLLDFEYTSVNTIGYAPHAAIKIPVTA